MARVICVYSWYRIYNNNVKTAEGFGTSAIAMTYNLAEWKGAFDTVSTEKSPFLNMGCTCFSWETEDGMHLLGRTYDQCGNLKGNRIAAVPRNYPLKLEINEREDRHIRSRYAFAGMAVTGLASPVMVDGINEMGVMGRWPPRISYRVSVEPVCFRGGGCIDPAVIKPDGGEDLWPRDDRALYFF